MRDVVFIAVDDLFNVFKYRDKFGPSIQTPNLDDMANTGVVFRSAFCTAPQCSPRSICPRRNKIGGTIVPASANTRSGSNPNDWTSQVCQARAIP